MLDRFLTTNPDTLTKGEQILSALVGATLASVAATAIASVIVVAVFVLL